MWELLGIRLAISLGSWKQISPVQIFVLIRTNSCHLCYMVLPALGIGKKRMNFESYKKHRKAQMQTNLRKPDIMKVTLKDFTVDS